MTLSEIEHSLRVCAAVAEQREVEIAAGMWPDTYRDGTDPKYTPLAVQSNVRNLEKRGELTWRERLFNDYLWAAGETADPAALRDAVMSVALTAVAWIQDLEKRYPALVPVYPRPRALEGEAVL